MAYVYAAHDVTFDAAAPIAFGQIVSLQAFDVPDTDVPDSRVIPATASTAPFGVAQSVATVAGQEVQVTVGGIAKVILGTANIAVGSKVTANANGAAVVAAAGNRVLGTLVLSGPAGAIGSVEIDKEGTVAA